jgi:hypothetical protein
MDKNNISTCGIGLTALLHSTRTYTLSARVVRTVEAIIRSKVVAAKKSFGAFACTVGTNTGAHSSRPTHTCVLPRRAAPCRFMIDLLLYCILVYWPIPSFD